VCGIFYSNLNISDLDKLDSIKYRGPENFTTFKSDNGFFAHALLSTIGPSVKQPVHSSQGTLIYNGSTYNYQGSNFLNDTQWIVANLDYKLNTTIDLIKSLRGEYALCYVTDNHVVFAADQWFTKNLWYFYNKSQKIIAVCSHPDVLIKLYGAAWPCEENTIYSLNRDTFSISITTTTEWNFDQTIGHLDYVFEEFEKSVCIRHTKTSIALISSGADSGAINCCLEKHQIPTIRMCNTTEEDNEIFQERIQRHNAVIVNDLSYTDEEVDAVMQIREHPNLKSTNLNNAKYNTFCKVATELGCKSFIVGDGADEIYADYGRNGQRLRPHSKYGGVWHENLELLWPWHNSYSILYHLNSRIDQILGFNGKETRIPYLDQELVQQWINTTVKLKNSGYKHWIYEYLRNADYPHHNEKIGFGGKTVVKNFCKTRF